MKIKAGLKDKPQIVGLNRLTQVIQKTETHPGVFVHLRTEEAYAATAGLFYRIHRRIGVAKK